MPETTTLLMTVEEVAETTRMSIKTIRRATQRGELQVVRLGRSVRVRPDDLTCFINHRASRLVEGKEA